MIVFISGGCKNGKSYYAQRRAKELAANSDISEALYYVATMIPHDEEDRIRIKRHLSEREGWGFETVEQGTDIVRLTNKAGLDLRGTFLFDSVTALMENEMYPVTVREIDNNICDGKKIEIEFLGEKPEAAKKVKKDCVVFAETVRKSGGSVVFVSDGIYGDGGEYSDATEEYRKALAATDIAIAQMADEVIEIAYGIPEEWK